MDNQEPMAALAELMNRARLQGRRPRLDEMHALGAAQFDVTWMVGNMLVIDGCRRVGVEPTELTHDLKVLLTAVAYRWCAHQRETQQAVGVPEPPQGESEESDGQAPDELSA